MKLDEVDPLTEAPLLIADLDWHQLNDKEYNTQQYYELLKYKYKKEIYKLTDTASIYNIRTTYFCLDRERKQITYYMTCQVNSNKYLGSYVWQSLVWVNKKEHLLGYMRDIPAKVFFEKLLTKYQTIITDSEQTWHGRRFWEYRVVEALHKGLNVYFYNFENNMLKQIHDADEVDQLQRQYQIWDANQVVAKKKRLVITTKTFNT